MVFLLVLVVLSLLVLSLSVVDIPDRARGGQFKLSSSLSSTVKENVWNANIDNFFDNSNNNTYEQRYFSNDENWNSDGPIFLYIGGEGTLTASSVSRGYITTLATKYSALILSLEHRYYGKSLPTSSSTDNLKKYLTVEQALADLSHFTDYFKSINPNTVNKPWFIFGGSYPGALASWYRIAYPNQSVGSLSSSGVVYPIVDYTGFDEAISAAVGNVCSDTIRHINEAFEQKTKTKEGLQQVLKMYNCEDDMWIEDFFYMIADSWSMAVQYSQKSTLCSTVVDSTNSIDDDQLMMTFANFTTSFWGTDFCSSGFYNTQSLGDANRWDINSRSWRFQTCLQMSMFNTAPKIGSLRSSMVNLDYHLRQCYHAFGENLEPLKGTMEINQRYGGDHPKGHNIFYSDFSDDPWQRASVTYPTSSDQPFHYTKCNNCGHCLDLSTPSDTDNEELKMSRADFETYMQKWIDSYSH